MRPSTAKLSRLIFASAMLALLCNCSRKPNVLIITFDTTRADAVGYANGRTDITPTLDKLASRGTWFSSCITTQPLTVPAHSSIMTGLFPFHHGVRNNGTFVLDKKNVTLAEIFKKAGYATHAIVSSFVLDSQFGLDQGFDAYDDDLAGGPQPKMFMFREIRAAQTANKAIAWLSRRPQDKPFFLWVHFYDPHADYEPPADIADRFPGEKYEAEVSYADRELGRIIAELDKLKLRDDTLIAFAADHGESLGDHGERSHGIYVYDSTTRVPLFFSGKRVDRGRVDDLVRSVDIAPTILSLAGLEIPKVDGSSLVPLMHGVKEQPRIAYSESFAPRLNFGWSQLRAERSAEVKYIEAPRPEVYDLVHDNGESNNLYKSAQDFPSAVRPFVARLRDIERNDPITTGKQQEAKLDAETKRKLAALGYVWGSDVSTKSGPRADPKDRIAYWERFQDAQTLIRKGDYANALQMVRSILAVDRDNIIAMASLANALRHMNQRQAALEVYQHMMQIDPERDTAFLGASQVSRELGRLTDAETYARTVVRLQPDNPDAYASLGDVLIEQNRLAEAEKVFRDALKLDPHSTTAISGLGNCLNRAGRLREALQLLRAAREHDPTSQPIVYNLAVVAERLGDPEGAKKLYEESLKLDPAHSMSWNNLGAIYDRAGNRDEAIRCVTKARENDPTNTEAAYNLGVLLMGAQRYADALPHLTDALRLKPSFVGAAMQRARVLTLLNRNEEALQAWKQLTAATPAAWLPVAKLSLMLGRESEARAALKKGLETSGEQFRAAASKDEKLKRLLPADNRRS